MAGYDRYPGIDSGNNFPPVIRTALLLTAEFVAKFQAERDTTNAKFTDERNITNTAVNAITANRQFYSFRWADATARGAQTGMRIHDRGIQLDTGAEYRYNGTIWELLTNPIIKLFRATGGSNDLFGGTGGASFNVPMTSTEFNESTDFFTVQTNQVKVLKAGRYEIIANARFDADGGSGLRDIGVAVNGALKSESGCYTSNGVVIPRTSALLRLAVNDVIGVTAYASSAAVIRSATTGTDVSLTVAYLGS